MPVENNALFVAPTDNKLNYASCVLKSVLPKMDFNKKVLWGKDATPENIDKAIDNFDPKHIFFLGHGSPDAYTCQNLSCYLGDKGAEKCSYVPQRLDKLNNRITHFLSCLTARSLGRAIVDSGAEAYIGYYPSFLFIIPPGPCQSKLTRCTHRSDMEVDVQLSKGKTAYQAHKASQRMFDKWIKYYDEGEGQNNKYAPVAVRVLKIDKNGQRLYGKGGTQVGAPKRKLLGTKGIAGLVGLSAGASMLYYKYKKGKGGV